MAFLEHSHFVFPSQIHSLTEIVGALTASSKTSSPSSPPNLPPSALDHSRHPHLAYQQPQHHVNPHLALALEKRKIEEQRSLNLAV